VVFWPPQQQLPVAPAVPQSAPVAQILADPAQGYGMGTNRVELRDAEGNASQIELQWSLDGQSWSNLVLDSVDGATDQAVSAAPTGSVHQVVWNAAAALGAGFANSIQLRARGRDVSLTGNWSQTVVYRVDVPAVALVAVDDATNTWQNAWLAILVLANDTVPSGGWPSVSSVSQPLHGAALVNPDQTVRYTPAAGYVGSDRFFYTLSDGLGNQSSARVTVRVDALNELITPRVSLPNTGGREGTIVQVPVSAANLSGLVSASLVVNYDPAVLRVRGAQPAGLTAGWTLAANTGTPGQVRLAMASPGPAASGSGPLATLEFDVLGAPGAGTFLRVSDVSLNDGRLPAQTTDGSFSVDVVYNVSGTVRYWNGGGGVPGVNVSLAGSRVLTAASDTAGAYAILAAAAGRYELVPGKSAGVNGISAYDASLALQHDARLTALTGPAAVAGDVDGSGGVTAMDAHHILRASVDLIAPPFPGALRVWDFQPRARSYTLLSGHQTGQDFTAILLGDVSGNWTPSGGALLSAPTSPFPAVIKHGAADGVTAALGRVVHEARGETTVWLLLEAVRPAVYSADLTLEHGPLAGAVRTVQTGSLADGFIVSSNANRAGILRIGLAGATPLRGIGCLLLVTLVGDQADGVRLTGLLINEGTIPVEIDPTGATFEQDSDGDGQSDWAEIRAGTAPADRQSVFAIKDAKPQPDGNIVVRWSSIAGKGYRLQAKSDLANPTWENVGQAIQANGTTCTQSDTAAKASRQRMYRVLLVE